MSLDQPAASQSLWNIWAATGIRPEFLIPTLSFESGLNPASSNSLGYSGLNGIGQAFLSAHGIAEATYLTWTASQQLQQVVLPYMQNEVSIYGPLTSGIRVYQANFYPASLQYAKGLDDTIVAAPSAAYEANLVLDPYRTGRITPRNLAHALSTQLPYTSVRAAFKAAYAINPGAGPMQDPIYGGWIDWTKVGWAAVGVGAGLWATWLAMEIYGVPRWAPSWVKRIT
jgi:hypothetical protein